MIKNTVFVLTKASQYKLKTLQNQYKEEIRKREPKNRVNQVKLKSQMSSKINQKIVAFVRGWKIRKIMKCQEIIDILKKLNTVSVSIKMSQFNPQTRNFIRDYMIQKSQIIDYFIS